MAPIMKRQTLSAQQRLFTELIGKLIAWAYANGFALTMGEAWRPPEMAAIYASRGTGIRRSVHEDRLGQDFNLFIDGKYITNSEAYKPLGEYWKTLHPLCRWGGDFRGKTAGDVGHFSMLWEGRA